MLYTVVPLDRIYQNQARSMFYHINPVSELTQSETIYDTVNMEHGFADVRYTEEGYVIERLHSTNMADYLKEEYQPGYLVKRNERNY